MGEVERFLSWCAGKSVIFTRVRLSVENGNLKTSIKEVLEAEDLYLQFLEEDKEFIGEEEEERGKKNGAEASNDSTDVGPFEHPDELPDGPPYGLADEREYMRNLFRAWYIQGKPCSLATLCRAYGLNKQRAYHIWSPLKRELEQQEG